MAAHSLSAAQEIVPNRIGKEVNMFASNWLARVASENETGLVNFVYIVFEQGDKMLNFFFSNDTRPIEVKFHIEPPQDRYWDEIFVQLFRVT